MVCPRQNGIFNGRVVIYIFRKGFFYMCFATASYKADRIVDLFQCVGDVAFGVIAPDTRVYGFRGEA